MLRDRVNRPKGTQFPTKAASAHVREAKCKSCPDRIRRRDLPETILPSFSLSGVFPRIVLPDHYSLIENRQYETICRRTIVCIKSLARCQYLTMDSSNRYKTLRKPINLSLTLRMDSTYGFNS